MPRTEFDVEIATENVSETPKNISFFTFIQEELNKQGYTFHRWKMFDEEYIPWYTIVRKNCKFLPFFLYRGESAVIRFPAEEVIIKISEEYKRLKELIENIADKYKNLDYRCSDRDKKIRILSI